MSKQIYGAMRRDTRKCGECGKTILKSDIRWHIEPWQSAADPEGYYDEENKAKHFGCICEWEFIYNQDKPANCNWGHGLNKRVVEKPNCPYHRVMY